MQRPRQFKANIPDKPVTYYLIGDEKIKMMFKAEALSSLILVILLWYDPKRYITYILPKLEMCDGATQTTRWWLSLVAVQAILMIMAVRTPTFNDKTTKINNDFKTRVEPVSAVGFILVRQYLFWSLFLGEVIFAGLLIHAEITMVGRNHSRLPIIITISLLTTLAIWRLVALLFIPQLFGTVHPVIRTPVDDKQLSD